MSSIVTRHGGAIPAPGPLLPLMEAGHVSIARIFSRICRLWRRRFLELGISIALVWVVTVMIGSWFDGCGMAGLLRSDRQCGSCLTFS